MCAALAAAWAGPGYAGILSKLLREAGEAGGKVGKTGIGSLDNAALALKKLPDAESGSALAVHATPEGHWVFANKKGETFTAGTVDELARAPATLLGETGASGKLNLYLTPDTIFDHSARMKALPADARLHVVANKKSYPLSRAPGTNSEYRAAVRSNVGLAMRDPSLFSEALYRLNRPLNKANIRVLALEPGGPKRLSSVPAYDPKTRRRLSEPVDPATLETALAKLTGQNVVLTGKVENGRLAFESRSGRIGDIALSDLANVAQNADVNLIVLRSSSSAQPGSTTYLWRTVQVDGLDTALKRPTFADFLESVTASSGDLVVDAQRGGQGRLVLNAVPASSGGSSRSGGLGSWVDMLSEQITGSIATNGVTTYTRDRAEEREHSWRLVPLIPSAWQFTYLLSVFAGLIGLGTVRSWLRAIWPFEQRGEYSGRIGYQAARIARGLAFIVIFLPLFGIPAAIWTFIRPVVAIFVGVVRFVGGLFGLKRT